MKFKSWRDYYLFVDEFAKYSCLNCRHWESSDGEKLPDDDTLFNLSEHILKKLEKGNRKWSIEDIRSLL